LKQKSGEIDTKQGAKRSKVVNTLRAFATPYGADSRRFFLSELAVRDTRNAIIAK